MGVVRRDGPLFIELTEQLLRGGCSIRFRAEGTSMHPAIEDGDLLTVDAAEATRLQSGDVIVYRLGSRALAHRVVAIRRGPHIETSIVPRGDAKQAADAPVRAAFVLGRVTGIEPGRSRHLRALRQVGRALWQVGGAWAARPLGRSVLARGVAEQGN